MTTLSEMIARLSPERRQRVEARANQLIAEERARRAKHGAKQNPTPGNGRRVHAFGKPSYARKAMKIEIGKRSFRGIRRATGRRSRTTGYPRYVSLARR